jgi:hypothetical protein
MSNIIELHNVRDRRLFDAHHSTLTELICAYAIHMQVGDLESFDRFLDAQDRLVAAYLALGGMSVTRLPWRPARCLD